MTTFSTILHVTACCELKPECCGWWDYSTETHYNTCWSTWI